MFLDKWNMFSAKDYELRRDNVQLFEVLGEGQFGDVYKGAWTDKVCRLNSLFIPLKQRWDTGILETPCLCESVILSSYVACKHSSFLNLSMDFNQILHAAYYINCYILFKMHIVNFISLKLVIDPL